ncbi:16S rRNA (adenine(1518)-N(6)/adenine(1519)-N(6))-dimethyltransferase RsmA [Methylocaldum szegediense]|jgi:16S rRNA (adenine1518-N6/adenine1519-N6)-dimethyltransferase|uniref:Ribosomal RNA small subunit methyltransferase A n=1 Tax=Methylocaldum szegediense TaxID=73780 RepID=A0ABN8X8B8_9GAMM|nr:16S rRNA (adenine(1518)-N(6)/adenine(1519)-N(6))-dimethyltransferase RsmA [Methylocaldum szegediense]CAI8899225.1 16S rRNA m(6)2A1518,m(6)2A1519 dimethyltransferase [Methylocaldum szegediense]
MNHHPRKRFGQNFLRDSSVVRRIVLGIAPKSEDHLVEIGPGQGVLTEALLPLCGKLDAVEIDRDLAASLESKFSNSPKFRLHCRDALKFRFCELSMGEKLRIVGNLPYNISTPLLFHLFTQTECIADMHFMLQKEVVDRLCAEPGDESYGRLGIMARYYCRADSLFEVPPEAFYPRPQVTSAVVRLVPHDVKPVDVDPKTLGQVVAAAFSQRRKTLRNALKQLFSEGEMRDLGIDPQARAETLGLEAYARLARALREKQDNPSDN